MAGDHWPMKEREPMKRFEGRTALVTGAGSGIGRATALRLAEEGARIFACDIDSGGLAECEAEAKSSGARVDTHLLDVANGEACREAVRVAKNLCGRLDVLCNIAGISMFDHMTEFSDEQWHRMVGVNLSSVFFLSQAAIPHLLESRGNIVNMASSAGIVGQAYNSMYCATKAGVVMLTKSMALEYGKRGVRVNAVCPGGVNTPLTRGLVLPDGLDDQLFSKLMPLVPMAEASEIASAVAYLASDDARYVTGSAFAIDGGQTAG
jgi:meso-butanediol dehydrogenase/(S,S)-butanediol dehydrogenase/diacetyl reductase